MEEAPALMNAMHEALQNGDMAELERTAHSLKGAASNLSSKVTSNAALNLEQDAKNNDVRSAKESLAEVEGVMKLLLTALCDVCQGVSR
jgi:HPt (histidine-containing phosphotransfer) domain-containing protein